MFERAVDVLSPDCGPTVLRSYCGPERVTFALVGFTRGRRTTTQEIVKRLLHCEALCPLTALTNRIDHYLVPRRRQHTGSGSGARVWLG